MENKIEKKEEMGNLYIRTGQSYKKITDPNVYVFAPAWVKDALVALSPYFCGKTFLVSEEGEKQWTAKKRIAIGDQLTLLNVLQLAKSDKENMDGLTHFNKFPGIDQAVILSLLDIAYHCVIVSKEIVTQTGGFRSAPKKLEKPVPAYIGHCSYPQFQQIYNTGRAYLISTDKAKPIPAGVLDDYISLAESNEKKCRYLPVEEVLKDKTRYKEVTVQHKKACVLDAKKYARHTEEMFVRYATGISTVAEIKKDNNINLKFLKGGTGFFVDGMSFKEDVRGTPAAAGVTEIMLEGIQAGLERTIAGEFQLKNIKAVELPYYQELKNSKITEKLGAITQYCQDSQKGFSAEPNDALIPTKVKGQIDSMTDNSDVQTAAGNEWVNEKGIASSVEPAIISALKGKGDNLSPILNEAMTIRYLPSSRPNLKQSDSISFSTEELKREKKFSIFGSNTTFESTGSNFPAVTMRYDSRKGLLLEFNNQQERELFLEKTGKGKIPKEYHSSNPDQFKQNPEGLTPFKDPDYPNRLIFPTFISGDKKLAVNLVDKRIVDNILKVLFPSQMKPEENNKSRNQDELVYGGILSTLRLSKEAGEEHKARFKAQEASLFFSYDATKLLQEKGSIEISLTGIDFFDPVIISDHKAEVTLDTKPLDNPVSSSSTTTSSSVGSTTTTLLGRLSSELPQSQALNLSNSSSLSSPTGAPSGGGDSKQSSTSLPFFNPSSPPTNPNQNLSPKSQESSEVESPKVTSTSSIFMLE